MRYLFKNYQPSFKNYQSSSSGLTRGPINNLWILGSSPRMTTFLIPILCIIFLLTACSSHSTRQKVADAVSAKNGFDSQIVKAGQFWLRSYQKITNPNLPFVFYIEGDGFAFKNKYTISEDPTPKHSTMLHLAGLDYRSNIVYLARPCQYLEAGAMEHCDNVYWTKKRLAPEVVDGMNEAIQSISKGQPVDLVGYSGGGGIAVLIADRNKKVRTILTLGALLDHRLFNEQHGTKPMIGSLNPIDVAYRLRNIPQLHISGGKDVIVRPSIADAYVRAANSPCVKHKIYSDVSHDKGWEAVWKDVLYTPLTCAK